MKKSNWLLILSLVILGSSLSSCAAFRKKRNNAYNNITNLKEGVLLVRLKTYQGKIKKLKEIGEHDRAMRLQKDQDLFNRRLMNAFEKNYDFSPVYFFYSTDSKKIVEEKNPRVFVNKDLKIDSNIKLNTKKFMITEYDYARDYIAGGDAETAFQSSASSSRIEALVMRDKNFVQMQKPFPYRVAVSYRGEANIERGVSILNGRLHLYHQKVLVKKLKRGG